MTSTTADHLPNTIHATLRRACSELDLISKLGSWAAAQPRPIPDALDAVKLAARIAARQAATLGAARRDLLEEVDPAYWRLPDPEPTREDAIAACRTVEQFAAGEEARATFREEQLEQMRETAATAFDDVDRWLGAAAARPTPWRTLALAFVPWGITLDSVTTARAVLRSAKDRQRRRRRDQRREAWQRIAARLPLRRRTTTT